MPVQGQISSFSDDKAKIEGSHQTALKIYRHVHPQSQPASVHQEFTSLQLLIALILIILML
jgi:hypothetical protein